MATNQIQFPKGMSLTDLLSRYGTEERCAQALISHRWPNGFRCPSCGSTAQYVVSHDARQLYPCRGCRQQTSLTAGTLMDSTKLPLQTWFLAIFLLTQAKTGLSALALMRQLGTSYRTAWLILHRVMQAMARVDALEPLHRLVQMDDAYLGGERPGVSGRGSPNKLPVVAAVSTNADGHPLRVKLTLVPTFSSAAISAWARINQLPGSNVRSDSMPCFAGVVIAGCARSYVIVGRRKPRELPQFTWVNIVLGNLKILINGAHKAFKFRKYAHAYLGAFAYPFNRRFDLRKLLDGLIGYAATMRE